jgi:hypothetical protein
MTCLYTALHAAQDRRRRTSASPLGTAALVARCSKMPKRSGAMKRKGLPHLTLYATVRILPSHAEGNNAPDLVLP